MEEIGDKIVLKSKPLVAPSAGRMVKEKIVDVPNNAVEKCQAIPAIKAIGSACKKKPGYVLKKKY